MSSFANLYIKKIIDLLNRISVEEEDNFKTAANMLADAIEEDGRIFAWGSTHSATTMQDIYLRAGGLALINAIFIPGLEALQVQPFGITSKIERLQGYAKIALDYAPIRRGDVLIVVSVSGRNAVPIEFAKVARERKIKVIAVTGFDYSKSVEPRHPDGKNMYEYADIVLDNKAIAGDSIMEAEGMKQKFCPASGITSTAVLQCMVAATVEELLTRGITPPVFMAQNVEGGEEYNKKMLAEYRDRIFYLKPE
ncbi:MAG TPA: SIS domain-containing protein [Actinobacteria bacterium]|nr:SIS domain-containing protein [Actinomycetota bacterium]